MKIGAALVSRMTRDQWGQIEELYHRALELDAQRRPAFIREACGGNEELQKALESLLAVGKGPEESLNATVEMSAAGRPFAMQGLRIGPYQILAQIGAGGMGEVYRARDQKLGRDVALKGLPRELIHNPGRLARFRREAQLLAALNHPNIAIVHGLEESGDLHCLVMELVPGQTLRERIAGGPLPLEEALRICLQVAGALEAAHRQGIVHRDIKPANIKVTPEGRVKVLDFGLAKAAGSEALQASSMELTQPGVILGTPAYMSPEQLRAEQAGAAADIWAFGCVCYELLTGRRPFRGSTLAEIAAAVLKTEPDYEALPPATPAQIRTLLGRCLEKSPGRRPASIGEAGAEIDVALRTPASPPPPREAERAIRSVAVLPFVNTGGDPETEYLSDGLAESMILNLSQLPSLRVMARGSVFRYKGKADDPAEIGRSLGVDAVLTGRVLQRGQSLVIKVELIDAAQGWQLWGAQYRKASADIFAIEQDIAGEITGALRPKLTPEAKTTLRKRSTENLEAYHLYLKGRFHWGKRTEASLYRGIQYFRQAIDLDPTYALAYAGLAEGYIPLAVYGHLAPREAIPKARAAAQKALEIDPSLAEAQTVLSAVARFYDWDAPSGEKAARAAIEMDPNYPRARQALAECHMVHGRFEEAFTQIKRALELDPLSLAMHAAVGMVCYYGRRYDLAVEYSRKAIEMDQTFYPGRWILGLALEEKRAFSEAVSELEQARTLSNDSTNMTANLAGAFASWGREAEARSILQELDRLAGRRYVDQALVAGVLARLGDNREALSRLERAYEDRSSALRCLMVDPRLDTLRHESRLVDLARQMGFHVTVIP